MAKRKRAGATGSQPEADALADVIRLSVMSWPILREHSVTRLAVVSSVEGEGTTTVACLLGQALAAQHGIRVLLFDGNGRSPGLGTRAGATDGRGWRSRVYSAPEDACAPSVWPGVHVCPHGDDPSDQAVVDSEILRGVIDRCAEGYDIVVLDCPPLSDAAQSLHMVRQGEALLLVVQAERLPRERVQHSCATLDRLEGHFLGSVLNQYDRVIPEFLYRRM